MLNYTELRQGALEKLDLYHVESRIWALIKADEFMVWHRRMDWYRWFVLDRLEPSQAHRHTHERMI